MTDDAPKRVEMEDVATLERVPQIFIDGRPIGGYDDRRQLEVNRQLGSQTAIDEDVQRIYGERVI